MKYVNLGKIVNVRGLKGELKVLSLTDFSKERYKKGNKVFFYDEINDKQVEFIIDSFHSVPPFDYLYVKGINDVDSANLYRNYYVRINVDNLPKLSDNSYYFHELINCEVFDENNNKLGVVVSINDNGAQHLLKVNTGVKNFYIPFVKQFINSVNPSEKKIIINYMEGLI